MIPPEPVAPADAFRNVESVLERDLRTSALETLAARELRVAEHQLGGSVPHAIRVHFESIEWDESQVVPLPSDYRNDWLAILTDGFPMLRNELAHGSRMLHASVLGTFTHVTDLVNQLYASKTVADRVAALPPIPPT